MLLALYAQGITADVLVGTGLGAFNAAFVASRAQTPEAAEELGRVWRDLRRDDVFPVSIRTIVGGIHGLHNHLVPDRALRRQVRRYIEFGDLSEAPVPLGLVAFDVVAGSEVLLSEGPAMDSIAAAAALPGVFPPVPIGARRLIDGSVSSTPISQAVALGAERVYILSSHEWRRPIGSKPCGALDAAIYGLGLSADSRLKADIVRHSTNSELILLPATDSPGVAPTDFDHTGRLIGEAHVAGRNHLRGL
jgi:NTE family protein